VLAAVLMLWVAVQSSPATQKIDLHWIYVNSDLKWESPPKELKKPYMIADNASLIILYPGGEYAGVSGTLFRERKNGRLSICLPCGFIVYRGTWKLSAGGTATIKSRWVSGGAAPNGQQPPGPEREENWKLQGRSSGRVAVGIDTSNRKYIPLSNLSNLSSLSTAVNIRSDH
jgi:hypothetical protein